MKLVLIVLTLIPAVSNAAEYSQFYLVNGAKVSAEAAILASMKGTEAFKCTSVQYAVSKTGTSIGIKAVKKPKATN